MIALKASIVVALAGALTAAMQRRSAAARHALLAASVVCAALMPLLERIAPGWGSTSSAAPLSAVAVRGNDLVRFIWAVGAAAGVTSLIGGLIRLAFIRRRAKPVVDPLRLAALGQVRAELGLGREVQLLEIDRMVMPATWGVLRPRVLLPAAAREWPAERIGAVLRHELAHVVRGDWIVNLLVELTARALWISPVMWYARRRIRVESERACDDAVLNLGVDNADYASQLLQVAREIRCAGPWAAAAIAGPDNRHGAGVLERRVAAILNDCVDRAPLSPATVLALAATIGAISIGAAGFGAPSGLRAAASPSLLDVQRDIMMRFGGEERRVSIVSQDVSFWKNRIEGRVELRARLNIDGSLTAVRLVEPVHPDLANAASVIVRGWRREPARGRGVPVEVPIRMTVDFR